MLDILSEHAAARHAAEAADSSPVDPSFPGLQAPTPVPAVGGYDGATAALTPEALPFLEAQATKRLGVVIDVEHVVSWDHRKLGGGY